MLCAERKEVQMISILSSNTEEYEMKSKEKSRREKFI